MFFSKHYKWILLSLHVLNEYRVWVGCTLWSLSSRWADWWGFHWGDSSKVSPNVRDLQIKIALYFTRAHSISLYCCKCMSTTLRFHPEQPSWFKRPSWGAWLFPLPNHHYTSSSDCKSRRRLTFSTNWLNITGYNAFDLYLYSGSVGQ